jgi:glycosyltransferase involved in cell wall biosynthesis
MIRVALVITELDVGGAERQITHLATGLDRRWYKPQVYALGPPPTAGRAALVDRLRAADVPVAFLGAKRWWHFQSTVQTLAALLREFQPHVMQSFLFHANVIGTQAARQAGVPKVSLGLRVADRRRWRAWLENQAALRAEKVVCVSRSVAAASLLADRTKLQVIHNGIDMESFRYAVPADLTPWGVPPGVRPITFVGRLEAQKGCDELLRAMPRILQRAPATHLLLVGDGPLRARLQAQAAKLGIAERVHFALWQENIPGILAASRLLVLTSRYEGLPNVVMEAMASGLAVVAMEVEGVTELLGDMYPLQVASTLSEFAESVAQLLQHEHLALACGLQNRARVEQHFSLPAMVAAYERLFADLAAGLPGTTQFRGAT